MNPLKKMLALTSVTLACGLLFAAPAVAQDIQNSVLTVGQMLKIDNAQALEKSQEEAVKAGVIQSAKSGGAAKVEIPLPVWTVRTIFGSEGRKFTDLQADASLMRGMAAGDNAAMCKIEAIVNECVMLAPLNKKVRKGSCPSKVCWTGVEISAEMNPSQTPTASSFKMMPTPLPAAPIPIPLGSAAPVNDGSRSTPR